MDNVTSIGRKSIPAAPTAGPHIDGASYVLLVETLIGYLELRIAYGDAGQQCDELERLNDQLQALARQFTPPKGVA